MRHYRLYSLDGVGRIGLAESIDAPNDADAVAQARDLKRGALKCEVWHGKRLVVTLAEPDLTGSNAPQSLTFDSHPARTMASNVSTALSTG